MRHHSQLVISKTQHDLLNMDIMAWPSMMRHGRAILTLPDVLDYRNIAALHDPYRNFTRGVGVIVSNRRNICCLLQF